MSPIYTQKYNKPRPKIVDSRVKKISQQIGQNSKLEKLFRGGLSKYPIWPFWAFFSEKWVFKWLHRKKLPGDPY